jgi:hypothetical protein
MYDNSKYVILADSPIILVQSLARQYNAIDPAASQTHEYSGISF